MAFSIFGITFGDRPVEKRQLWSLPNGWGMSYPMSGPGPGLERALLNTASYACIDVLVDHISAAPLDAIRYIDGGRQPVEPLPLLLRQPSATVTADVWRAQLAWALVTDGNAFGQIVEYSRGLPRQVEWLDPTSVTERKVVDGRPQVRIDQKVHRLFPLGDILHIPGRMIPSGQPFALSPIEYANQAIGTSLSALDYTSSWFTGGGHPSLEIIVEGLATAEQAQGIKSGYQGLVRTGEPWVHGDGIESKSVQAQPDTTAISVLQQAAIMACQVWHVPPSWIYIAMSGQNVTYANVAQADVAGLKDSIDVYWRRIEGVLTLCLQEPQVVRANRDATLRTDAMTRVEVQEKRLANKLMSVNEGRKQEDERPWDDPIYDEPGLPSAPAPVEPSLFSVNGDQPAPTPESDRTAR